MAVVDNPDFELGDEYTGPAKGLRGEVINMADGTFVEGGVRYVWTGEGSNFKPEGGWGMATDAQTAEDDRVGGLATDQFGVSPYKQITRADGSPAPGVYRVNENYYAGAQTKPVGGIDAQGRPEYIDGPLDRANNPTWVRNPDYNKPKGVRTTTASGANPTSVYATVNNLLKNYGFSAVDIAELAPFMQSALINNDSADTITQNLRETPVYKRRFPGMALRQGNNYNAINEADYLLLEDGYVSAMRLAGLPEGFYDDRQDFANFIGNDVSVAELQRRVNLAQSVAQDANPEITAQLEELYNIDSKKLVAFYLDPTETGAQNLLAEERKVASASLSASVLSAVGQSLNVTAAERLQKAGITLRDTRGLNSAAGVLGSSINEQSFSASDLAEGTFGTSVNATDSLRRRVNNRTANFRGKSGLLADSSGFSGLGEAV